MKFNELPKFVVNLETRPDRLEDIKFELDYIGWDYEVFSAVNTARRLATAALIARKGN